MAALEIGESSF